MNANEHGFVLAKFQPPKGERIVECEDGEFILHCDHIQITKRLEESNLELSRQNSALQLSQDNIINALGITGDGPVSKSVIEYVMGLVAENERAVAAVTVFSNLTRDTTELLCDEIGHEKVAEILGAFNDLGNMPNTDSAIADIGAKAVEKAAESAPWLYGSQLGVQVEAVPREELMKFAANLRAGRKG